VSTRLERARRDHAIALLSAGVPTQWSAQTTLEEVSDDLCVVRVSLWDHEHDEPANARILRARVALFLRLVRRCEAWEAIGSKRLHWSTFERCGPNGIGYWVSSQHPAVPWRPLWTSAPPHNPSTTPAQRRASRRGMVSP
jgi:hypothetical protein